MHPVNTPLSTLLDVCLKEVIYIRRGNGDGSIFKLSGKRRKPYAVRVTVGWTSEGKQIYKYVGYYSSKTDAKLALNKYLADPSGVIVERATLKYVFDRMIETSKYSDGTIKQYRSAFNQLDVLHNKLIDKIQLVEYETIIKTKKASTQKAIKKALASCYQYALKHEYAKRNLSEFLEVDEIAPENRRSKTPFTSDEISRLWSDLGRLQHSDIPIILLYSGMRINELLSLERDDVNFKELYLDIRQSKTEAGVRKVPIHDKILPLIRSRYDDGNKYLISHAGRKINYTNYHETYWHYRPHTPHETRHTFITALGKCDVDPISIRRIAGHSYRDVTERYTHRTQAELLEDINKLQY